MGAMANTKRIKAAGEKAPAPTIHRLKVTLRGSEPPIWRRLEVPSDATLAQLHYIIQAAFGWENYHMWVFRTPTGDYGLKDRELEHRDAVSQRLSDVASRRGARFGYTYDFGDDWEHDILVEAFTDAEPGTSYPRCIAGERACPPEDCGGIWGYQDLLEILADPDHGEHAERLDWLGLDGASQFDPAAFDVAEVNSALSPLVKILSRS
jgi:Plasmid pRiA4b ORF-3-like protein